MFCSLVLQFSARRSFFCPVCHIMFQDDPKRTERAMSCFLSTNVMPVCDLSDFYVICSVTVQISRRRWHGSASSLQHDGRSIVRSQSWPFWWRYFRCHQIRGQERGLGGPFLSSYHRFLQFDRKYLENGKSPRYIHQLDGTFLKMYSMER